MNKFTPNDISTILFRSGLKEEDVPNPNDHERFYEFLVMNVPCNRHTAISAVRFPGILPVRVLEALSNLLNQAEVVSDMDTPCPQETTAKPEVEQLTVSDVLEEEQVEDTELLALSDESSVVEETQPTQPIQPRQVTPPTQFKKKGKR